MKIILMVLFFVGISFSQDVSEEYKKGLDEYQKKNYLKAIKIWKPLAKSDYHFVQHNLGHMYSKGLGVKKDMKEAIKWYEKASKKNFRSQFNLGNIYFYGEGVNIDLKKAASLYKKSADQGHPKAQNNLANMYSDGKGVKKNKFLAYKYYKMAAKQSHSIAQDNLNILCKESPWACK